MVSLLAFISSPFITNDGLCLLLVTPVLDGFSFSVGGDNDENDSGKSSDDVMSGKSDAITNHNKNNNTNNDNNTNGVKNGMMLKSIEKNNGKISLKSPMGSPIFEDRGLLKALSYRSYLSVKNGENKNDYNMFADCTKCFGENENDKEKNYTTDFDDKENSNKVKKSNFTDNNGKNKGNNIESNNNKIIDFSTENGNETECENTETTTTENSNKMLLKKTVMKGKEIERSDLTDEMNDGVNNNNNNDNTDNNNDNNIDENGNENTENDRFYYMLAIACSSNIGENILEEV